MFPGFRVDLVEFVRFATYSLLKKIDVSGVEVDIWGDGFVRGKRETTRIAFRLLHTLPQNVSQQSCDAVFTFAAYYGKDSRFNLEQNIGWTSCGDQETSWLYQQTKKLSELGCHLTLSGDSPFLLRLVMDINKENCKEYPSWLPLYVGDTNAIVPTSTDPETGFRTKLHIPFKTDLPTKSLVFLESTKAICPDVTHMTTRNVENDLRKMVDKIISEKLPKGRDHAIKTLEDNINRRDVKRPRFGFTVKKLKAEPVSLGGREALVIIADTSELSGASEEIVPIFEGVWNQDEILAGNPDTDNCLKVLRKFHPHLFNKTRTNQSEAKFISIRDAADLLFKSLNNCIVYLRNSKDG